jgi:hypothetical protein
MPLRVMNPDPHTIEFAGPDYEPFIESQGIPRPDSPTFAPVNYLATGLTAQEAVAKHRDQIEDVTLMVTVVPPAKEDRMSNFVPLHDPVAALKTPAPPAHWPTALPPPVWKAPTRPLPALPPSAQHIPSTYIPLPPPPAREPHVHREDSAWWVSSTEDLPSGLTAEDAITKQHARLEDVGQATYDMPPTKTRDQVYFPNARSDDPYPWGASLSTPPSWTVSSIWKGPQRPSSPVKREDSAISDISSESSDEAPRVLRDVVSPAPSWSTWDDMPNTRADSESSSDDVPHMMRAATEPADRSNNGSSPTFPDTANSSSWVTADEHARTLRAYTEPVIHSPVPDNAPPPTSANMARSPSWSTNDDHRRVLRAATEPTSSLPIP